ncbi:hypothetical protein DPMN_031797 [Dreissena polymorpha]|uniref:Uncharacterized protein n=1 Tax=Dreissena polymorpha TaxID=45954 RepID=A0A9D4M5B0_DREPO|nr:hypothetical protein DPMN_031797 [Dreissena polymorpha]
MISGIPEERDDNCLHFPERLEVDPCPPSSRSYRLGKFRHGSSRPIIVCLDFPDTEHILSNDRKLRGTYLVYI